jgi:hypothetical protein
MSKADDAALKELRSAESRAERLSAVLRAVIFLVLLTVFASIEVGHSHEIYAMLSLSLYGGVTVAALVFAWRRLFHPALVLYAPSLLDRSGQHARPRRQGG